MFVMLFSIANMPPMEKEKPNPLPPLVYAFLVALAFAVGLISLGNEAGWWSIGE